MGITWEEAEVAARCPPISPNPNSPNLGLGLGNGIGRIGIGRNGVEPAAQSMSEWCRSVAHCIHFDAG